MIKKIREFPRYFRQQPRLVFLAVAVVISAAISGVILYRELVLKAHQQRLEETTEARATQQASQINQFIAAWQQRLASVAETLAEQEMLPTDGHRLQEAFPEAEEVRLLVTGDKAFAGQGNYVALDMVRRVLKGEQPQPEAMKLDQWYILFVVPVSWGDQIMAALLVSLPAKILEGALAELDVRQGATRVTQAFPGTRAQPFITLGGSFQALASAQRATRLPHWQLTYAAAPQLAGDIARPLLLFTLAAAALAMLVCLALAGLYRLALRQPRVSVAPKAPKPTHKGEPLEIPEKPVALTAAAVNAPAEEPASEKEDPPLEQESPDRGKSGPVRIFRDYDIRGVAGEEITADFATGLGRVLGTRALAAGETVLAVGMDGRTSSPELGVALIAGILASGCNVLELGQVPTPLMNFALNTLDITCSGVMVTASHNPAQDNGFKIVMQGAVLNAGDIASLQQEIAEGKWRIGAGKKQVMDIRPDYLARVKADIMPLGGLRVVVDCGNGIAGTIAPELLKELGAEVTALYCEPDGTFPNHDPDPLVSGNLKDLITIITHENADVGLAIDGDGDRLVAVSSSGRIVWPDELLMIFARDVLARHPGADVVFDVKSTRRLYALINSYGGRPVMWKTGHAPMRNKVRETNAPVGGEFSGHLFFNERWFGFDDGLYAAARLLEIMAIREQGLDDILSAFPVIQATPEIKVAVADEEKFDIIHSLLEKGHFNDGKINRLDGLRVEFPDAWGLVRASNTTPALTLRFEADNQEALDRVKTLFREQLLAIAPGLPLDF